MENSSLRGRFSLSTTNLSSPIAESTCLNGSSSHSKFAKFNWGEGNISVRSRNNTQAASKNNSMAKNVNGTPPKVTMSPSARIDPRTYVDIHSNGLTSRIVKYHDNSARLNRSLSMGSLYNKPGQFPVVHLKKNEMQYKAKKNRNLSMTRIAAPEKSVFHGNTLSSILRSGSIVGLQKSDEEISHENRPILHPPPTENEMAPTRSVLEVLKEISRKRINSDELDGTELIKKYCKEPDYDAVPYNGQKTQSKRQREISTSASSSVQISPEQQAVKRRMCNYNNDIMSSLSSSMISINKKKMLEMQSQKRTASDLLAGNTSTTSTTEIESMRQQKQRCIGNLDLENLVQPSKYTLITPLPSTPQQSTMSCEMDKNQKGLVTRRASEPVISNTKPKLTLFNKDYDEVPTKVRSDTTDPGEDGDVCGIQFVKPKKSSSLSSGGTLLMEKTKKSKLALMLSGLKGELNEEDEVDAVPTAVPQQQSQVEVKLSVTTTPTTSVPSTQAALTFGTTTTAATTVTATPEATIKPVGGLSTTKQSPIKGVLQFNPSATTTAVTSSTSNGFQIPATTTAASTSSTPALIVQPAVTTSAPISTATSTTSSIPTLGGFSFGLNKPLTLPTTATTAPNTQPIVPQLTTAMSTSAATKPTTVPTTVSATAPAMKPFAFGLPTTQAPATTAPSFTFGAPSTTLSATPPMTSAFAPAPITSTSTTTSAAPPPVFGQSSAATQPTFTFGSLAASNANSTANTLTTAISAASTSSASSFSFGASKSSWAPSTAPTPVTTNPIVGIGSFGGVSTSTSTSQSTSTVSSTTSTGGFSFGGSSTTEPSKNLFGSIAPATTSQPTSNTTFSFGTNKTPATQPNPTNAFTFGSAASPPAAINNPIQPPAFGSTTPVKPANSFSFGAPAPAAPLKGSFSFPSADKPAATTTASGSSIGGFSFNAPASNSNVPDSSKNIFGNATPAAGSAKPAFSFGSTPSSQATTKPTMFGASGIKPTNLFGAPPATTTQSAPFAFGSSSGTPTNQGAPAPSTNLFGSASSNPTGGLGATTNSSSSIFGAPAATVAPLQQSSTFTFGSSSSSTTAESNKPAGGFVFGSSSSIGSNVSKPSTDLNKTFVFGDGSTTITPAPPTNVFGGGSATNGGPSGTTDNKLFSFGGAGAVSSASNNAFGNRQTVNQSPSFNFGSAAPALAQNGNLFAAQPTGTPSERPIRKAMRRLHKT